MVSLRLRIIEPEVLKFFNLNLNPEVWKPWSLQSWT